MFGTYEEEGKISIFDSTHFITTDLLGTRSTYDCLSIFELQTYGMSNKPTN